MSLSPSQRNRSCKPGQCSDGFAHMQALEQNGTPRIQIQHALAYETALQPVYCSKCCSSCTCHRSRSEAPINLLIIQDCDTQLTPYSGRALSTNMAVFHGLPWQGDTNISISISIWPVKAHQPPPSVIHSRSCLKSRWNRFHPAIHTCEPQHPTKNDLTNVLVRARSDPTSCLRQRVVVTGLHNSRKRNSGPPTEVA
jgi:hypothetical protein